MYIFHELNTGPLGEVGLGRRSGTDLTQMMGDPSNMDEREMKRLKRKQSNRESARRSRMRKQQETEELADANKRFGTSLSLP